MLRYILLLATQEALDTAHKIVGCIFQGSYSSSRSDRLALTIVVLACFVERCAAQAPVNDVISWPAGLLLLATVLYAALGNTSDQLWAIEPAVGFFLADGLPHLALPLVQNWRWHSRVCHFIPRVRRATGKSNFWLRSEHISEPARNEALERSIATIPCLWYGEHGSIDREKWRTTAYGLVYPLQPLPTGDLPGSSYHKRSPTAQEYLLFAAIGYHLGPHRQVDVKDGDSLIFTTDGLRSAAVIDADNELAALIVVVSYMLRRPVFQRRLRHAVLSHEGHVEINLQDLDLSAPACVIDFHSYAPPSAALKPSLREIVHAYLHVLDHIKSKNPVPLAHGHSAAIHVGRTLWVGILGGALLDSGRLTIQNIPSLDVMYMGGSLDGMYLGRVEEVLRQIQTFADDPNAFNELVSSGGLQRFSAWPFFLAGLSGQALICYFLSVGTTAGIWTSVALSNSLLNGRLTDIHSMFCGKHAESQQPGFKMYVPNSNQLMCIATLNRSPPAHDTLRPGLLLNIVGVIAASLGAVFQGPTRRSLGFGKTEPAPPWVLYTAVGMALAVSILPTGIILGEIVTDKKLSRQNAPSAILGMSTVCGSLLISGLAVFFQLRGLHRLWPVLDALTFVSGFPLGMIENGWMFGVDENTLHLCLLNRWIMGAIASSLGSGTKATA
ncbi:hypothetical protein BKA62DRAFT_784339 [Auriculariales sp. MPI-PUGE-AT-0066]|nr:hypothetical protein BKA62DRAFT_784339 [Auriculariales sp. MPI-PUGE-AT-0066]